MIATTCPARFPESAPAVILANSEGRLYRAALKFLQCDHADRRALRLRVVLRLQHKVWSPSDTTDGFSCITNPADGGEAVARICGAVRAPRDTKAQGAHGSVHQHYVRVKGIPAGYPMTSCETRR